MSINCSLIIDSCCDLPRDVVDAEGVKVVGFSYNNESGSHIDDMYASLTAHDFYEAMRGGDEPSTSQVTLGEFLEVFNQASLRRRKACGAALVFERAFRFVFDSLHRC